MNWEFIGNSFGWDGLAASEDRRIDIEVDWHLPSPSLNGPTVEMELEDAQNVFASRLSVSFRIGSKDRALEMPRDWCFMSEIPFQEPKEAIGSLHLIEQGKWSSLNFFLPENAFNDLLNSMKMFASSPNEKYFRGQIMSPLMDGELSIAVQPERKREFLEGKRSVFLTKLPNLSFIIGKRMPEKPSVHDFYERLKQQF